MLSYHPHGTNQQGLQKIVARKKNPINDIVDTVGAWLGGRGPGTNPQVQAAMQATRAIAQTADTATGGFGQALLSDAQRMAMTGSSTPSALYKTAAVNLGAAAAGVGAAKVAGKVVQSGIPARAARAVTGRNTSYFVHGSPTKGIKKLDPIYETMPNKIASDPPFEERWPEGIADPSTAGIYGWPITRGAGQKGSANVLTGPYSGPISFPKEDVPTAIKDSYDYANYYNDGSLYIAKAPRSSVGIDSEEIISSPAKVVKEIRTAGKSADQVVKETEAALKKMGFRYPRARGGGKNKR